MQLRGTCSVTNGSARVIAAANNDWSGISANCLFSVPGTGAVLYIVTATTAPGLSGSGFWELTLSANYAGTTGAGLGYQLTRDFTPNLHMPLVYFGDRDTGNLHNRALAILDELWTGGPLLPIFRKRIGDGEEVSVPTNSVFVIFRSLSMGAGAKLTLQAGASIQTVL